MPRQIDGTETEHECRLRPARTGGRQNAPRNHPDWPRGTSGRLPAGLLRAILYDVRAQDSIEALTRKFRTDDELFWHRLRSAVTERGLLPDKALLVDIFSEGSGLWVGVVVCAHRAYFFEYADTHEMPTATITRWLPLQDGEPLGPAVPFRHLLPVAMEMSQEH